MTRSRLMRALALFACLVSQARAELPATIPASVAEHRLVRCRIDDDAKIRSAAWFVFPAEVVDTELYDGGKRFAFTAPPGRYQVNTVAVLEDGRLDQAIGFVIILPRDPPGPTPNPPGPTPSPPVPPGPKPPTPPTPNPEWGRLTRLLVLYEAQAATGREPYYSAPVQAAMTSAVPKDANGTPQWRIWDVHLDTSNEPEWNEAVSAAKSAQGGKPEPVLYAFDDSNRMRSIPLAGLTDAEAIGEIRDLRTAAASERK